MDRILVIRGGALGDFILTLPAIKTLRDAYPAAHLEILGYKHIVMLAEQRFYAQAVRSIDYAPMARFFARDAELAPELVEYFGSFDLVVSYLFDPDAIFETNLKRCRTKSFIAASPKIEGEEHAALQFVRPLRREGLVCRDHAAKLYPSQGDREAAATFRAGLSGSVIALHPGSGSEKKNWPIDNWVELGNHILSRGDPGSLFVLGGEADEPQLARLQSVWKDARIRFAKNLPLPHLAALLEGAFYIGHDSGISHLAAAAGARCLLLFGPTDPEIWAPANENVRVIRAASGKMEDITFDVVAAAVSAADQN